MDPILAKVEAPPTATFLNNKHSDSLLEINCIVELILGDSDSM
jgi:hypothetical protein